MPPNPKPTIYVLEAAAETSADIRLWDYRMKTSPTLAALTSDLAKRPCMAVILDLDSVPLDNRAIRNLACTFPSVSFFGASRDRFHPELKDAICYHLFACMTKPIDSDELHFFLKCIRDKFRKE